MTTQTSKAPADVAGAAARRRRGEPCPRCPAWRRKLRPYLLSIPAVVIVIGILYPFAVGAYYAFLNYAAVNPDPHFVWFENFKSVLGDQVFWQSVKVTGIFAVVGHRRSRRSSASGWHCCSTGPRSSARSSRRC